MLDRISAALRAQAERDGRGYPDWAMRYLPVLRRWKNRNFNQDRILEIGANENGFARFAGAPVIALDVSLQHLQAARRMQNIHAVVADATALPFADHRFDICVCMDTFEHIPKEKHADAAGEIARVLRADGVGVIAFPSGDAALRAETRIRAEYARLTGRTIHWLDEHAAQGLPDAETIRCLFERHTGNTHAVHAEGNASLWIWVWMWRVLMCQWPGRGNALAQIVLRWLTPVLSRCHRPPCYRAAIWLTPKKETVIPPDRSAASDRSL